jgi:hypothetical protein
MKAIFTIALSTLIASQVIAATPSSAPSPEQAFEAIKKLKGEWRGPAPMKGMPPLHSVYRITAGGSAVQETSWPGGQMEMVSLYHMNKGELLMTHYCILGNQPRMKYNPKASTATELAFDFDGGTNLNPRKDHHMHSMRLTLPAVSKGPQTISITGTSWKDGKPGQDCGGMKLKRAK